MIWENWAIVKSPAFILLWMIFMHVVDDYYLQGILAKLKCRDWWRENHPEDMYRHDWMAGLFFHAFSWTFMIMLPLAYWGVHDGTYMLFFLINLIMHMMIDYEKANMKTIGLLQDQTRHLLWIFLTWVAGNLQMYWSTR